MLNTSWKRRAFKPLDLFAGSRKGWYLLPSDLATTFQDTGGTTAANTNGAAVQRVNDKSGNGNHFALVSGQTQHSLAIAAGLTSVDTAGSGGFQTLAGDGIASKFLTIVLCVWDGGTQNGFWFSHETTDSALYPYMDTNPNFANGFAVGRDQFNWDAGNARLSASAATPVVLIAKFDMTATGTDPGMYFEVNGVTTGLTDISTWSNSAGSFDATKKSTLGAGSFSGIGGGMSRPISSGGFYFALAVDRDITAGELAGVRTAAGNAGGLSL